MRPPSRFGAANMTVARMGHSQLPVRAKVRPLCEDDTCPIADLFADEYPSADPLLAPGNPWEQFPCHEASSTNQGFFIKTKVGELSSFHQIKPKEQMKDKEREEMVERMKLEMMDTEWDNAPRREFRQSLYFSDLI